MNLFQALLGVALTVALYFSIGRTRFSLPKRYFAYAYALLVSSFVTEGAALYLGSDALVVVSHVLLLFLGVVSVFLAVRIRANVLSSVSR